MIVTLDRIGALIGAEIPSGMENLEIAGIASLEDAGPGELSFLANPRYAHYLEHTAAAAVILSKNAAASGDFVALRVDEPYIAFVQVLSLFDTRPHRHVLDGTGDKAFIHPDAMLAADVTVGSFAVIGPGVTAGAGTVIGPGCVVLRDAVIGSGCVLYPNVTVMDGSILGDRVVLHAGVVIGSDGFGFAPGTEGYRKIPQIGRVRIGDDVEIGANTTIDRAAFGETIVENGAKIDNLVMLAHNTRVGANTVIAAQVGIAGSSRVGSGVQMGGQAGMAGHLAVGDNASVGAQAGVTRDVPPGEMVSGYPARKHASALRMEAALAGLPDLMKKIREQERRIGELERTINERSQ